MNALVTFYCLCMLALGAKFIWKSIRLGRRDTDGTCEPIVEEPAPIPADDPRDRLDHLKALYEAGVLDREEYSRRVKQHRERTEAR